jgi:hypothetical protein
MLFSQILPRTSPGTETHPESRQVEHDRLLVLRKQFVFGDRSRIRLVVGRVASRPFELRRRRRGGGGLLFAVGAGRSLYPQSGEGGTALYRLKGLSKRS